MRFDLSLKEPLFWLAAFTLGLLPACSGSAGSSNVPANVTPQSVVVATPSATPDLFRSATPVPTAAPPLVPLKAWPHLKGTWVYEGVKIIHERNGRTSIVSAPVYGTLPNIALHDAAPATVMFYTNGTGNGLAVTNPTCPIIAPQPETAPDPNGLILLIPDGGTIFRANPPLPGYTPSNFKANDGGFNMGNGGSINAPFTLQHCKFTITDIYGTGESTSVNFSDTAY
jgi:hypothetical protein